MPTEVKRTTVHSKVGETARLVTIAVNAPYKIKPEALNQLLAEAVTYDMCVGIDAVTMSDYNHFAITFVPNPAALEEPGGLALCEAHIVGKYAAIVAELDVIARSDRLRASVGG